MAERLKVWRAGRRCGAPALGFWSARQQLPIASALAVVLAVMALGNGAHRPGQVELERMGVEPVEFRLPINTAPWSQLVVLPGISRTRAERIVLWRQQHGPFRSPDDLQRVHGVGPKLAAQLARWSDFHRVAEAGGRPAGHLRPDGRPQPD